MVLLLSLLILMIIQGEVPPTCLRWLPMKVSLLIILVVLTYFTIIMLTIEPADKDLIGGELSLYSLHALFSLFRHVLL